MIKLTFFVGIFSYEEKKVVEKRLYTYFYKTYLVLLSDLKNLVLLIRNFKVQKESQKSFNNEK